MIDFLVSIPAILCRADVREFNPYAATLATFASRHDYSADGIFRDALITTINQFDSAKKVAISEQANTEQPSAA